MKRLYFLGVSVLKFPQDYYIYKNKCNIQLEQKTFFHQMLDMMFWGVAYGEYFDYYFLSGANFKHNAITNYISGTKFRKVRDERNYKKFNKEKGFSDILILRNKLVFEKWMTYHKIPTVTSLGQKYGRYIKFCHFDDKKSTLQK